MLSPEQETLQLRMDLLVDVVAVLARSMPAEKAAEAQAAVSQVVARRLEGVNLSDAADRTVAADLARLVGVAPLPAGQAARLA